MNSSIRNLNNNDIASYLNRMHMVDQLIYNYKVDIKKDYKFLYNKENKMMNNTNNNNINNNNIINNNINNNFNSKIDVNKNIKNYDIKNMQAFLEQVIQRSIIEQYQEMFNKQIKIVKNNDLVENIISDTSSNALYNSDIDDDIISVNSSVKSNNSYNMKLINKFNEQSLEMSFDIDCNSVNTKNSNYSSIIKNNDNEDFTEVDSLSLLKKEIIKSRNKQHILRNKINEVIEDYNNKYSDNIFGNKRRKI